MYHVDLQKLSFFIAVLFFIILVARKVTPEVSAETIQLTDTLNTPHGIAVDDTDNIYIAEMGINRILIIGDVHKIDK